jgi:hypothetical protein
VGGLHGVRRYRGCVYPRLVVWGGVAVTMTHTPGPWTIHEYGEEDQPTLVIHQDSKRRICFMATPGSHGDPAIIEANAHLICAAPDMIAALIEAEYFFKDDFPDGVDGPCAVTPRYREAYRAIHAAIAKATRAQP